MAGHVLMLAYTFPSPSQPYRGTYTLELLKELGRLTRVTVVAPVLVPLPREKFRQTREAAAQVPQVEHIGPTVVYRPRFLDSPRFGRQLNNYFMTLSVLVCMAQNRLSSVDLIHGQFAEVSGHVAVLIGRLLRKPVVTTAHGSEINVYGFEAGYELERKRVISALTHSTRVIAVSRALAERVIKLGAPAERVTVITNGVDIQKFRPMEQACARAHLGLPQRDKIILYVGSLLEHKGLGILSQAGIVLRAKGETPLIYLVGDGDFRENLASYIAEHGLDGQMRLFGARPHDELPFWMNAADVLVLPSFREGWPTVLFESLACGTPVVATKVGGIPEAIHSADYGLLVEPGDAAGLAETLREAFMRSWDKKKLVAYAQENTWSSKAEQTCQVYQQVTQEAKKA